ncbi:DedA family protein [Vibrio paucivorans]|uniref:DedA family protein n=1 Tax=Vibrio paucivorans TaxID=2829489 RepID=A0A9X3HTK6_9VIBR|nr:DedA family protein [Vibrio paucivorans]MCW8335217.1 DedA family protein [Vibrio paucivorans]
MSGAELQEWITHGGHSLTWLFVGVILLSYLLEDLAIVTAAGLAAQEVMPASWALLAIFVGIATGDLGLYYLGRGARTIRVLRYRSLTNKYFKQVRSLLHRKPFINLFIIRFIPGMRTVGFTLSGFFSIPLSLFLLAVVSATSIWTAVVFGAVYQLGSVDWLQSRGYQWLTIPVAFGVLFAANRILNKSLTRGIS